MIESGHEATDIDVNGGKHGKFGRRFDLIPPRALDDVAVVLHEGCATKGELNWLSVSSDVHLNHLLAHLNAFQRGDISEDHAQHAVCRAMMWLELLHIENE